MVRSFQCSQPGSIGSWGVILTVVTLLPIRGPAADDFSRWNVQPPVQGLPIDEPAADVRLAQAVIGQPPCPPPTSGPLLAPNVLQPDPVFTCSTLRGGTFQCFPSTLLWEPPLASKAEPRMALLFNTLDDATSQQTVDGYIGATVGLFRLTPAECPWAVQLDFFGLVGSRFSQYDYLITLDYRAGLPITWACGSWHGKIGYEHTSTHLGDDVMVLTGRQPIPSVKDELVVGLGRWFWNQLRVYGEFGYAFFLSSATPNADPVRFAVGAEWRTREATGFLGKPFAAVHLAFPGDQHYATNLTVQAGWMWRQPAQRLANFRIFGEYYTGRAPFGQLFQVPNQFFGLGLALDY
jgi:hypothetical protein